MESDSTHIRVLFEAEITVSLDEVDEANGDQAQAVQNLIGQTGAVVIGVITGHG